MDQVWQDLRYAFRAMAKSPGWTAIALVTLALGIGANATIFHFFHAALWQPPQVEHAGGLAWVWVTSRHGPREGALSYPDFAEFRDHSGVFTGLVLYEPVQLVLRGAEKPERIRAQVVTPNYFHVLGVKTSRGRLFHSGEGLAGKSIPEVILSHRLWQRRFAGEPDIVGQTIVLNGRPFSVAGISAPDFTGLEMDRPADAWVPLDFRTELFPAAAGILENRGAYLFRAIGRLKPGTGRDAAEATLNVIAQRLAQEYPERSEGMRVDLARVQGGAHPSERAEGLRIAALLLSVTGVVLLIACVNVANLLLVRSSGRGKEFAIRMALGASRGRVVRQLLTESVLLAALGGAAGALFALWGADLLAAFVGAPETFHPALQRDSAIFLYAALLALLTGIGFGFAPAFHSAPQSPATALKEQSAGGGIGTRRTRLQSAFVVAQVALSLVLLASAGVLLRSLLTATSVDPGFDLRRTVALSFDLSLQDYSSERADAFRRALLEKARALPGVESASLAAMVPMGGRMVGTQVAAEGSEAAPGGGLPTVYFNLVWPDYFRTLGIPLLRGRDFTWQDDRSAPGVVVVSETLARQFWPGESPIGKRIRWEGPQGRFLEVIAEARDIKYHRPTDSPRSFMYLSALQHSPEAAESSLIARVTSDPAQTLAALERVLAELDGAVPVSGRPLAEFARDRLGRSRRITSLLGISGGLALLLASVGLYGVMAFAVTQRRREIGIRMTLGAQRRDILRMFLARGSRLVVTGVCLGIALGLAATNLLSGMLFGVHPADVITFAGVALLLGLVALLACWIPARRATRVDPMVALRYE